MSWNQYTEKGISAVLSGDFPAAEKFLKTALHHAKETYSRYDGRFAMAISVLGHFYFCRTDFARAEKLLEQSLRLHADAPLLNDPCVLMDLFALAEIKQANGDLDAACRLCDETLDKIEQASPLQPEVVKEATQLFRQVIQEMRPQVEPPPPAPPKAQAEAEAEPEPEAELEPEPEAEPVAKTPGPNLPPERPPELQPERLSDLPMPAMEYRETGTAGEIWQQQFQTGLASMKMDDAETEELITAYLNFESAYRLATGMFRKDDMRLIATIKGLADASTKLRLFDQAELLYKQAIDQARSNPEIAAAAGNSIRLALGLMCIEAGRFQAAKTILDEEDLEDLPQEAAPLRKRISDGMALLRLYHQAESLLSQAESAELVGDFEKASKLANNAISQLKQGFPPGHIENARVLRYRASLLTKLGSNDQAAELNQRAERIEKACALQDEEWNKRTEELPRIESDTTAVAV